MKATIFLFAVFFSSITFSQTPLDSAKTEEDFSMYADVEEVPSKNKSKVYCSQKILGLSPSKLISIGFDFLFGLKGRTSMKVPSLIHLPLTS